MNRRAMLAMGLAVTAGLPLAACGSSNEPADESGPVELTISVWNLASTPEFQALFDAFQKANPQITIKPVDILAADYPTKVTTMLAAGDSTDVITMKNVIDYARYASRASSRTSPPWQHQVMVRSWPGWTRSNRTVSTSHCRTGKTSGCCTTTRN